MRSFGDGAFPSLRGAKPVVAVRTLRYPRALLERLEPGDDPVRDVVIPMALHDFEQEGVDLAILVDVAHLSKDANTEVLRELVGLFDREMYAVDIREAGDQHLPLGNCAEYGRYAPFDVGGVLEICVKEADLDLAGDMGRKGHRDRLRKCNSHHNGVQQDLPVEMAKLGRLVHRKGLDKELGNQRRDVHKTDGAVRTCQHSRTTDELDSEFGYLSKLAVGCLFVDTIVHEEKDAADVGRDEARAVDSKAPGDPARAGRRAPDGVREDALQD